ncbi:MAG: S1C family serine protease, partial [Caldimonas sp.]
MKRVPLYSRSRPPTPVAEEPASTVAGDAAQAQAASRASRGKAFLVRNERRVWAALLVALVATLWWSEPALRAKPPLTMEQIDAGIRQSIEEKPLVSPVSRAYEAVIPSVVRVVGLMTEGDDGSDKRDAGKDGSPVERGVGSGVVIIDNGTILTNLHVV